MFVIILGETLNTQILPIPDAVKNIPGRDSSANYELIFLAKDVPGLGFKSFYVSINTDQPNKRKTASKTNYKEEVTFAFCFIFNWTLYSYFL